MALAETGTWKWDEEAFVKAWEAGVFGDQRVELVEGEVWPVVIGDWHGTVTGNVSRLLPNGSWRVVMSSLPSSGSVPDPDLWVRRRGAQPTARLGTEGRLARWDPTDIGLVVEVSDTSFSKDTTTKQHLYGGTGYSVYWVVHPNGVEEYTEPYFRGFRQHRTYLPGEPLPVPYAEGLTIAVDDIFEID